MITGIGNDLVDIRRIEKTIKKFGDRFIDRCFTDQEIKMAAKKKKRNLDMNFYAKRFAAKEAIAKAMGTGISGGIKFKEISIENNESGKPIAILSGKAFDKIGGQEIHVSISDEYPYAQAFAIIERK